jgi:hypothetical protein
MTLDLIVEFVVFFLQFMFWMLVFSLCIRAVSRGSASIEEEKEELKDKLTKLIHVVKPEKHGDMIYWFDYDTDAFLGQGHTDEEIIAQIKARFPSHIFIIDEGQSSISAPDWQAAPLAALLESKSVNNIVGRIK